MMKMKICEPRLSVCQITSLTEADLQDEFFCVTKTRDEISLVCTEGHEPSHCLNQENGFRAMYIDGVLDFSLIGILAEITGVLAARKIGVFAISTYNTDYILIRENDLSKALSALAQAGYIIEENHTASYEAGSRAEENGTASSEMGSRAEENGTASSETGSRAEENPTASSVTGSRAEENHTASSEAGYIIEENMPAFPEGQASESELTDPEETSRDADDIRREYVLGMLRDGYDVTNVAYFCGIEEQEVREIAAREGLILLPDGTLQP